MKGHTRGLPAQGIERLALSPSQVLRFGPRSPVTRYDEKMKT
jgi:hypothetical protein